MTAKRRATSARTITTVEAEIATHEQKRSEAEAELGRLCARRPAMLLDLTDGSDERLDELDREIRHAQRVGPRVDAAVASLEAELAEMREAEKQARCEALYAEGLAARDEWERMAAAYNMAAAGVADILREMARLNDVIRTANGNKPHRGARIEGMVVVGLPAICTSEGQYPVADRVRLPGMLDASAAWPA